MSTEELKKQKLRQDIRDILLFTGSMGIIASLFLLLASLFTTIKIAKLSVFCCLCLSSVLFFKGLDPSLQRRLKDNAKINLSALWQKLKDKRTGWVAAS